MSETGRQLVTPGTLVAKGRYKLEEGVFREGDEIYSSVIGLLDIRGSTIRVIPLEGPYIPKPGDRVIGVVTETQFLGWMVRIRAPTPSILKISEVPYKFDILKGRLEDIFTVGDLLYAEVLSVNEVMQVKLTMMNPELRKLVGGRIFLVDPTRIPRVIGRRGSMVSLLKANVCPEILIGQNGVIWTRCNDPEREELLGRILRIIEREAHTSGLTNKIRSLIQEEIGLGETRKIGRRRKEVRRKRPRRTPTH